MISPNNSRANRVGCPCASAYRVTTIGCLVSRHRAATARLTQLYFRAASVLARAEVPVDIRTGDNADEASLVYCEVLSSKAEPLLTLGLQALEACQKHTKVAPAGWWAELCVALPPK